LDEFLFIFPDKREFGLETGSHLTALKSARLEAQTPKSPRTLSFWRICEDGEKVHAAQPMIRGFWMRFQGSATP